MEAATDVILNENNAQKQEVHSVWRHCPQVIEVNFGCKGSRAGNRVPEIYSFSLLQTVQNFILGVFKMLKEFL